ncbi:PTS sugar transporter subunit IIC [Oenococcus sp. UCMA 14587]|nr:PTS sugar transporter subunit IIC [Oenococcus sp. UCMA 14587]
MGKLGNLQKRMEKTLFFSSFYISLKNFLPIIVLSVFLQLFINIFLTSNSFFLTVFHLKFFAFLEPLNRIATFADISFRRLLMPLFAYFLSNQIENQKGINRPLIAISNFIVIWLFSNNQFLLQGSGQNLLLVSLIVFILTLVMIKISNLHKTSTGQGYLLSFCLFVITCFFVITNIFSNFQFVNAGQWFNDNLISDLSTNFYGVALLTVCASLLLWMGLPLPSCLRQTSFSLPATVNNLGASLDKKTSTIPNPLSLHTLYDSFAVFGGVSMSLALIIVLLIRSKHSQKKLAQIALIPSLLNNNQILNFGLPFFLNPLLLIPAILAPLSGILLSGLALKLNLINPAVYQLPKNTPNIFTAFLSSNGDWRTILLVLLILGIGVLIYLPFVNRLLKGAGNEES